MMIVKIDGPPPAPAKTIMVLTRWTLDESAKFTDWICVGLGRFRSVTGRVSTPSGRPIMPPSDLLLAPGPSYTPPADWQTTMMAWHQERLNQISEMRAVSNPNATKLVPPG